MSPGSTNLSDSVCVTFLQTLSVSYPISKVCGNWLRIKCLPPGLAKALLWYLLLEQRQSQSVANRGPEGRGSWQECMVRKQESISKHGSAGAVVDKQECAHLKTHQTHIKGKLFYCILTVPLFSQLARIVSWGALPLAHWALLWSLFFFFFFFLMESHQATFQLLVDHLDFVYTIHLGSVCDRLTPDAQFHFSELFIPGLVWWC